MPTNAELASTKARGAAAVGAGAMKIADEQANPVFTRITLSENGTASAGTQFVAGDFDHDGDVSLQCIANLAIHILEIAARVTHSQMVNYCPTKWLTKLGIPRPSTCLSLNFRSLRRNTSLAPDVRSHSVHAPASRRLFGFFSSRMPTTPLAVHLRYFGLLASSVMALEFPSYVIFTPMKQFETCLPGAVALPSKLLKEFPDEGIFR